MKSLRKRVWMLVFLFGASGCFCASFSVFAQVKPLEQYPDDMLILKFTMGQKILLAENIIAYPNANSANSASITLSLQEFVTAIEFPITVDPAKGRASGWFIQPQRGFDLNLPAGSVTISAKRSDLNPQLLQWVQDDIFVDITLLAQWFGLTFNYDAPRQTLNMTTNEPLPFQQKWAREAQRNKLENWLDSKESVAQIQKNLPVFKAPYGFFSLPNFTLSSNAGVKHDSESTSQIFYQYNGAINHDLLYQNAKWFFKGDNQAGLSDLRLTMGRQSESQQYSLGDNYSIAVPLVTSSVLGRGLNLSTFDLGFRTEANAVTLRGDHKPGWDIELYRNNALVNAAKVKDNGTYEFIDVPLTSGNNTIKLIFYGPLGEREERTESYLMHPDLAPAGQFSWRTSWHQQQTQLFKQDNSNIIGSSRFIAQSEYGFSDSLSLSASWVDMPLSKPLSVGSPRHRYMALGSRFSWAGSYFRQQFIQDLTNQASALQLFASTQRDGVSLSGQYQQFSTGFISDSHQPQENSLKSKTVLNLHQSFKNPRFSHLSVGLKAQLETLAAGDSASFYTLRQSVAKDGLSLSNELRYGTDTFTGAAVFNLPSVFNVKLRGQLKYQLKPQQQFNGLSLSGEYPLSKKLHLSAGLNQTFEPRAVTGLDLRLAQRFDGFKLDFAAQYQTGGHYNIGLTLSFNLDGLGFSDEAPSSQGRVNARVFLDHNANQRFDQDDVPLPDVHFSVDGRASEQVSDHNGLIALSTGANRPSVIKISPGVYGDYYWDVEMPERVAIAHPGKALTLDFAARLNGEIEGMVYSKGEHSAPLSGVLLELVDDKGRVVNSIKSGFDGFYLFEKIPFGQYRVRVSEAQLKRLNYQAVLPLTVVVSEQHDIVMGNDFYLSK